MFGVSKRHTPYFSKRFSQETQPEAPQNNQTPIITTSIASATPTTDVQLEVTDEGQWSGFPKPTFTYQWYRGALAITGATNRFYIITALDLTLELSCRVTATNGSGSLTISSNVIVAVSL